jgi:hypothetical protein
LISCNISSFHYIFLSSNSSTVVSKEGNVNHVLFELAAGYTSNLLCQPYRQSLHIETESGLFGCSDSVELSCDPSAVSHSL